MPNAAKITQGADNIFLQLDSNHFIYERGLVSVEVRPKNSGSSKMSRRNCIGRRKYLDELAGQRRLGEEAGKLYPEVGDPG